MNAQPGTQRSEINVTPFLDVLLVLLVIFMAAMQAQRLLWAHLPVTDAHGCSDACESIVLEVLPGSTFALNKVRFGKEELAARLRAAYAGRPRSVLFVKGDPTVSYQDVVSAIDEAVGAGLQVLAIAPKSVR